MPSPNQTTAVNSAKVMIYVRFVFRLYFESLYGHLSPKSRHSAAISATTPGSYFRQTRPGPLKEQRGESQNICMYVPHVIQLPSRGFTGLSVQNTLSDHCHSCTFFTDNMNCHDILYIHGPQRMTFTSAIPWHFL